MRDALVMGPWRDDERPEGYRRPPGDYRAEHMLLRVVRCIQGQVDLVLNCEPAFDYGRTDGRWDYAGPGWTEAIARGGENDPPSGSPPTCGLGSRAAPPSRSPDSTTANRRSQP